MTTWTAVSVINLQAYLLRDYVIADYVVDWIDPAEAATTWTATAPSRTQWQSSQ